MNPRNVAIIQARMGSSRFPGKMLARLGCIPLLEWVVRRLLRATSLAQVVLATSDGDSDDALAGLATRIGIAVFRGSEADVLGRFAGAASMAGADNVVRICADNPFIDPAEVDRLVRYFAEKPCDYACNHQDRLGSGYADGFGAEILSAALLGKIAANARELRHREHVTLYLWDHASEYTLTAVAAPAELAFPELRFDVDTPADLANLEVLVRAGAAIGTPARDIIRIAQSNRRVASAPKEVPLGCADFQGDARDEFADYLQRLFPLCRSITGNPNRETLRTLQELIPFGIHEVPSGTSVYDWTVPDEWNIRDAWIADSSGRRIVDFRDSNLHVVSYSEPVKSVMNWAELQARVHRHPQLADAIPYRTSYYKRDWGFCVTHAQFAEMERLGGPFTVVIDSELKPGSLTYGEYLVPGRSAREILLSCYICHPSMANDSLSGVLLTAFLARHIASLKNRHWSYRIVFVPETIGAITYCARNEAAMKRIDMGLVITTVGGPGKFGYKRSFDPSHPINTMIEDVFRDTATEFITYPFDIHGSDERQYSSQGFRINAATICRDRYYEYPYYHSSLDDLAFVTPKHIAETLDLYVRLIDKIEARRVYRNQIPHGEVMLSRHDLYPATGGAQRPELGGRSELDLILWLLFLCDGKLDIDHIAERLGVSCADLVPIADRLVAKDVLEIV
jgi:aminopeptidase-like protein/spore coat polysaccharide biosynthesis protein SpsF (cytidylyltransferase family)